MQLTTDSTVSYTQAEDPAVRQDMITYYVDQIIGRLVERPHDSVPQLFQFAVRSGPCLTPADVLRLFGGRIVFRRTCRRMNLIRRAVLNDEMDTVPVDLDTWTEWGQPGLDPPQQDRRGHWCPQLGSQEMFGYELPGMEEEICRYPAVIGTDELFQETEDESYQTDVSLINYVDSGEWFGVLDPISVVRSWEEPDISDLMDQEAVSSEDEDGSEEWRRPPPINTAGLEWFYE